MSNAASTFGCATGNGVTWRVAISLAMLLLLSPLGSLVAAQTATPVVASYTGGISTQLDCSFADQCQRADRQDVFSVEPGTALRAEFGFVQWYPEPKKFRLFLLLNYQQSAFSVQQQLTHDTGDRAQLGSSIAMPGPEAMQLVWDFTVPPEEEFYFEIRTAPLDEGYYDLALLVVPDPNKTQRELPYWTVNRSTTQATVYVGKAATPPAVAFPLIDPKPHEDSGFGSLLWFGREPYKLRLKGEEVANAGAEVTFDMNFQPYGENFLEVQPLVDPVPTAFVAVIDDRVVPINDQSVLYGSALPWRLSYLPVTVTIPDDPGIHQLFVQQFPYPYVDVAVADETGLSLFGESSQRLILDVR